MSARVAAPSAITALELELRVRTQLMDSMSIGHLPDSLYATHTDEDSVGLRESRNYASHCTECCRNEIDSL